MKKRKSRKIRRKKEKKRVPKSNLTQRQAIPWPCPAHGSSQKGSPEEGGEGKKGEERRRREG